LVLSLIISRICCVISPNNLGAINRLR